MRIVPKHRSGCTANIWQVSVEPPPRKLQKSLEGESWQAPEQNGNDTESPQNKRSIHHLAFLHTNNIVCHYTSKEVLLLPTIKSREFPGTISRGSRKE